MLRQHDVVIAVDSENFLDNVTFAIDINHICRHGNHGTALPALDKFVIERGEYPLDDIVSYGLADK